MVSAAATQLCPAYKSSRSQCTSETTETVTGPALATAGSLPVPTVTMFAFMFSDPKGSVTDSEKVGNIKTIED